jgi:hypothetical protein
VFILTYYTVIESERKANIIHNGIMYGSWQVKKKIHVK